LSSLLVFGRGKRPACPLFATAPPPLCAQAARIDPHLSEDERALLSDAYTHLIGEKRLAASKLIQIDAETEVCSPPQESFLAAAQVKMPQRQSPDSLPFPSFPPFLCSSPPSLPTRPRCCWIERAAVWVRDGKRQWEAAAANSLLRWDNGRARKQSPAWKCSTADGSRTSCA